MSTFGRALGGLGAGVSSLASRYIDEELAQQRAQALADMQLANQKKAEDWQQSDEVQGRRLVNQRRELDMRSQASLQGKEQEAASPALRQARVDNEVSLIEGTTPARIASANAVVEGTAGVRLDAERMSRKVLDPLDVSKAAATAEASWAAREKYDQRLDGKSAKSAFERLPEGKKLEVQQIAAELKDINKAMIEAQAGGGWDPAKNPGQKQLDISKAALQQRLRGLLDEGGNDDPLGLFSQNAAGKAPQNGAPEPLPAAAKATRPALMYSARQLLAGEGRGRDPAPPNSPQAKWEGAQAAAREQASGRDRAQAAAMAAIRDQFDADLQSMDPLDLVRKYGDMSSRRGLDTGRLAELKRRESQIR